jgi:hypothetical protein
MRWEQRCLEQQTDAFLSRYPDCSGSQSTPPGALPSRDEGRSDAIITLPTDEGKEEEPEPNEDAEKQICPPDFLIRSLLWDPPEESPRPRLKDL